MKARSGVIFASKTHQSGGSGGKAITGGAGGVDAKWAERIRAADRRVLARQFHHEACELHRLLSHEQHVLPAGWRDFRQFLADVGPSPGPRFRLQRVNGGRGPYQAGAVAWLAPADATTAAARPPPPPDPTRTYSQWTMVSGMPVQHGDLPTRLGVSYSSLSAAVARGESLDAVATHAREATADVADLGWLSPQEAHQRAFRTAYVAWRLKVLPKYRSAATPKFLYLHTLVLAMARSKAILAEAECWKPLTGSALAARDTSPAWKSYSELLPKAMAVLSGFDIYRQYSLTEDIDELSQRIEAAERRFRGV